MGIRPGLELSLALARRLPKYCVWSKMFRESAIHSSFVDQCRYIGHFLVGPEQNYSPPGCDGHFPVLQYVIYRLRFTICIVQPSLQPSVSTFCMVFLVSTEDLY